MSKAKPKNRARQVMKMINIPVTPGCDDAITNGTEEGTRRAKEIAAAIDVALALDYVGALTVEFFYFRKSANSISMKSIPGSRWKSGEYTTDLADRPEIRNKLKR